MTKVEAIVKVMEDNGGVATLSQIYNKIDKYYPNAKDSKDWTAGIRGVLYRELRNNRRFKKIGLSIYALDAYQEDDRPSYSDKLRMHSFIEGICIELGNFKGYNTYTADPSATYRDNVKLHNISTLIELPQFTYDEILSEVKRIDVIWFNNSGFLYPNKVFEVVDTKSTLLGAFNRALQLSPFNTAFYIVAPEKHREKYNKTINLAPYSEQKNRFSFVNYNDLIALYDSVSFTNKLETKLFK